MVSEFRPDDRSLLDYLDQLETEFEHIEPRILSFVPEANRFERVRSEVKDLQARFPIPDSRPSLYGVILGVKDVFHVDGLPTRAGSKLPEAELSGPESTAVTALKEAGALILGKTVTTEFAYFGPGPTRNPHNPDHTPGGSSSGSAAAVGAGICPLALGTQTIGSINRPAAYCGVVGYKPSYDRISRDGVIPLAPSLDHVGVFAPDVAGIVTAAPHIIADWDDTPPQFERPTLGIPTGPYLDYVFPEGMANFQTAIDKLKAAGYVVKETPALGDFDEIMERHLLINAVEAARVHQDWYRQYADRYHPRTVELIERGMLVSKTDYDRALPSLLALRRELQALMRDHDIQLFCSPPAQGTAPRGLSSTGNPVMNLPWTHAGVPTLSLPSGKDENGLPFGFQLAADSYQDEAMLFWALDMASILAG